MIRVLVPLTNVLVCGLVAWPQRTKPVTTGSRFGMVVPVWVMSVLAVLAPAALAWVAALVVMPVACPACVGALDGPCVTAAVAPRKRPPAFARRMLASAIWA